MNAILPGGSNDREFAFSDEDFQQIARLARTEFGLSLAESKKPLVYSRLAKRLRIRNVTSFRDYLRLLSDQTEEREKDELLSALTTNVTRFFREMHHFDLFRTAVLPRLIERARSGARVRIWSAGCSSGQEPYSLALMLLAEEPLIARHDVKILATDIDPNIVATARAGRYPLAERASIPEPMLRFTEPEGPKTFQIAPPARDLVTFGVLNLIADWPIKGQFDVIFCRNVTIYFDAETQRRLWTRFQAALVPDGYLFIGHSERVSGPASSHFASAGVTAYQNIPPHKQTADKKETEIGA